MTRRFYAIIEISEAIQLSNRSSRSSFGLCISSSMFFRIFQSLTSGVPVLPCILLLDLKYNYTNIKINSHKLNVLFLYQIQRHRHSDSEISKIQFLICICARSSGVCVGSIRSDKYHLPSCYWAQQINPSKEIWFTSKTDAASQGYVACKVCEPRAQEGLKEPIHMQIPGDSPIFLRVRHLENLSPKVLILPIRARVSYLIVSPSSLGVSLIFLVSVAVTANIATFLVIAFFALVIAYLSFRRGLNPDNIVIPAITTVSDTVITIAVTPVIYVLKLLRLA